MIKTNWTKFDFAVHPGEILNEYLEYEKISKAKLSKTTGIKKKIVNDIVNGKIPITFEIATKLEKAFSFKAKFWNNLQMIYDEATSNSNKLDNALLRIKEMENKIVILKINNKIGVKYE